MGSRKQDIGARFLTRAQAVQYRDRFKTGRRRRTHTREERALRILLDRLRPQTVILDVGSGAGRFVPELVGYGGLLIQLDYSRPMLEVSKEDHPLVPPRGAYVQGDARSLPFATDMADLIFCHRLLNHITDAMERGQILEEMARVTRRHVVLSCLSIPTALRCLRRAYSDLVGRRTVGNSEPWDLINEAQRAGLKLDGRVRIRSIPVRAEFLIFQKR